MITLEITYNNERLILDTTDAEVWISIQLMHSNTAIASVGRINPSSNVLERWWDQLMLNKEAPIRIQYGMSHHTPTNPYGTSVLREPICTKSKLDRFKELQKILSELGYLK